jgi:hypothetical protein
MEGRKKEKRKEKRERKEREETGCKTLQGLVSLSTGTSPLEMRWEAQCCSALCRCNHLKKAIERERREKTKKYK